MARALLAVIAVCTAAAPGFADERLSPPVFARGGAHAFATFAGVPATARIAWAPVPGAASYRATWTDPTGRTTEAATTTPVAEAASLAVGHYQLAVAAVDARGAAGPRSEPYAFDVMAVEATPAGASGHAPPTRGAYAVGSKLSARGLHCELDSAGRGPAGNEVRLTTPGVHHVRCDDVELPVVVAPVIVDVREPRIAKGRTTVVRLTVASVAALGDDLAVAALGDAEVGDTTRTPGGVEVPVTVAPDARRASLVVSASGLELGTAALSLIDAPPPAPAPAGSGVDVLAVDLGFAAGMLAPLTDRAGSLALGGPADTAARIGSGGFVAPSIGWFPARQLGLEAELGVAEVRRGGSTAVLGIGRVQLAVRAIDRGRLGVLLIGGAGVLDVLRDLPGGRGELHFGAALTVAARPGVWFRLQAADVITSEIDAGFAHLLELQLAVVTRVGRRDTMVP